MEKVCLQSGIVLINKPVGVSSNTAVNIVKHSVGAKKAGHLGTLDLEGAGLLLVTINSATKLFDFFLQKDKTYESEFVFGFETYTLDLAGNVIAEKPSHLTLKQVEDACKKMIGKQLQMPPMFSAKKVGGKVAYKEALKGNKLDLKPKEIEIFDLKVLEKTGENTFKFEISCSSGTYIRSLCRDLAQKLDTLGTMKNILRTRCGKFMLDDASTLDQVKKGDFEIIPCEKVFDFKELLLDRAVSTKLLNGMTILTEDLNDAKLCKDGSYKIFCGTEFLGIGEVLKGKLKLTLRLC